ncbi:hypothetical protein C1H46_042625 [Malus baccata]|uniref:AB hydrolase-1 domain-containing protein n=1 Tax=Malus baccata TaxID=106549 RepID=A0A540KC89_MALBA|nr:hypothetical protein C1H46_042625 [Malus baccata]
MTEKLLLFVLLFIFLANASTSTPSPPSNIHNQTQSPKHFVLIHGACHGAWSWYKVATLLKDSGHNVTALDLGASGINPIQVQQLPSLSEFVDPLTKVMVSLPPNEKVVLVGHSLGGAVVSIFMERFPQKIAAAVFVTAVMYGPTLNFSAAYAEVTKGFDVMDSQYIYDNGTNNPATSFLFGPKVMAASLYQLSPPQILQLQECLSKYERNNDGSTPRMNQLQSELRLARSLIAERDSEIQQVRTTNNHVSYCIMVTMDLNPYLFFFVSSLFPFPNLRNCNTQTVRGGKRKVESHFRRMEYTSSKGIVVQPCLNEHWRRSGSPILNSKEDSDAQESITISSAEPSK